MSSTKPRTRVATPWQIADIRLRAWALLEGRTIECTRDDGSRFFRPQTLGEQGEAATELAAWALDPTVPK